jgi:chemotaxis protein CheC
MSENLLTHKQKDALQEAGNISAAYAATALSKLLGETIMMDVTECKITQIEKIPETFGDVQNLMIAVYMKFKQMERTQIVMLFPQKTACRLCDMFKRKDVGTTTEIGGTEVAILTEIGNICICAYMNALSKMLDLQLTPTPPIVATDMIGAILDIVAINVEVIEDLAVLIETAFIHKNGRCKGHLLFMPDQESKMLIVDSFKFKDDQ